MPGKKGSSRDATEELGVDGFGAVRRRASASAGSEADPEDEPVVDEDLDEDEFDDLDEDDLDEDDEDEDDDDDLIDLDDEFDDGPEEETRPQHPGKYEE